MKQRRWQWSVIGLSLLLGVLIGGLGPGFEAYATPKESSGHSKFVALRKREKGKYKGNEYIESRIEHTCESSDPLWNNAKVVTDVRQYPQTGRIEGTSLWTLTSGDQVKVRINGKIHKGEFRGQVRCVDASGKVKGIKCDGKFQGKSRGDEFSSLAWNLEYER
jgi:hypothetical protein